MSSAGNRSIKGWKSPKRFFGGIFNSGGFTLVEALLVLSIIGLSLAIVYPSVASGLTGLKTRGAAKKVVRGLINARELAISDGITYYAKLKDNKLVIEQSSRGDGFKKEVLLPEEVFVRGGSITFFPRGSSSGGAFTVEEKKRGTFYVIKVEPSTGKARVIESKEASK